MREKQKGESQPGILFKFQVSRLLNFNNIQNVIKFSNSQGLICDQLNHLSKIKHNWGAKKQTIWQQKKTQLGSKKLSGKMMYLIAEEIKSSNKIT